jgi:nicotinamidase-related amidase
MHRRSVLKAGLGVAASSMASALAAAAPAAATRHESGSGPTANFPVIPLRTALINVDMQNCFVEGYPVSAPEGPGVLSRINRLAAACRSAGILVIHTAHVLRADGSNAGVMSEFIPAIRAGMINKGSQASALHKSLVVDPRDILLEKPRFGAFQGTDLELILRAHDINSVIIGGIATNVCCETTAREAATRDFRVFFLSDGTATFDLGGVPAQQLQAATCASLALFGQVLTVEQIIQRISAAHEHPA